MKIRVLLFAILKDAAGTGEVGLDVPEGASVAEIRDVLGRRFPALGVYLPRVAFAVNRTYASIDTKLKAGDEVALIPPVSGGSEAD